MIRIGDRLERSLDAPTAMKHTPTSLRLAAALSVALLAPQVSAADSLATGFSGYIAAAEGFVSALDDGTDPASLAPTLSGLASDAEAMIEPFSARHPACADYLQAARGLSHAWAALSLEDIERDYHHDGALPKIADANERTLCYQMKDLLVHPLTALRLLAEPTLDRAQLRHEIVEVLAHGKALQALGAASGL